MLFTLVLTSALAAWFWWQIQGLDLAVAELVDRIRSLEEWRARLLAQPFSPLPSRRLLRCLSGTLRPSSRHSL